MKSNRFQGLQDFLKNTPYVGFYTDENLDDPSINRLFSHAQLILAPTLLDVGNLDHDLILFYSSSLENTLKKIKEINAVPLKINKFGVVLARRGI